MALLALGPACTSAWLSAYNREQERKVDMAHFSPENARVIEIALEHRVGVSSDDDEWRRALVTYLESRACCPAPR